MSDITDITDVGPSASPSDDASASPSDDASASPSDDASGRNGEDPLAPPRRKRRPWRIALIATASLLALAIAVAAGGYAYINHLASSIPRIKVAGLVAATSPGQTILVTASPFGSTGSNGQSTSSASSYSRLFMLLHIDANGRAGGAVTILGDTIVNVPGHGAQPLWRADEEGGPSLVVKTITNATGVPINHYARIDFTHIANLLEAVGGITVTIPETSTAFGQTFPKGANFLTGVTAVYYARDPALSDEGRTLRQEVIVRETLAKIADYHLLINPVTMVSVLNALTGALTVDSNLTNSQVISLATKLGGLSGSAATFVTAPTQTVHGKLVLNTVIASQLWTAVKQDDLVGFAKQYPSSVTPQVVP
jgi:LCP family protein required for cell wall assembly